MEKILDTRLKLVSPTSENESEAKEYLKEHFDIGEDVIHGINEFHVIKEYDEWLKKINYEKEGKNLAEDIAQSVVYFAYNKLSNQLVGTIHIRYELVNKRMIDRIGHIGIGIRPSERAKGYGKELMLLAIEECRKIGLEKALVVCNKLNQASSNTLKSCGGILENEITIVNEENEIENVLRYWIDIV